MAHGRTRQPAAGARRRHWLELSPAMLSVVVVVLAGADWGSGLAGDSFIPGGPLDGTAHLLTTLLVLWALGSRACGRFLVPALVASAAIDLDHLPGQLGTDWFTAGTPRPYTHSLLTIIVLVAISMLWHRRRDLLVGVVIGLAIHFWRDMGEGGGGVALLWPLSNFPFQYPHGVYVAVIALVVVVDAAHSARRRVGGRSLREWKASARRRSEPPRERLKDVLPGMMVDSRPITVARRHMLRTRVAYGDFALSGQNHELMVGQILRQVVLGTEAVYRVCGFRDELVEVEVVRVPGLQTGQTFHVTRDAAQSMDVILDRV